MLEVSATAWAVTIGLILLLLVVDLALGARRPGAVSFREAVVQSVFYIGVAIAFGVVFGSIAGWDYGAQYFAGWVVEKSLSVDNLFVFVIIMTTFAVPAAQQHRVLTFGIIAALVLRTIFIVIGAALLAAFSFMFVVFGLLLIATAIQLFRHRDEDPAVEDNPIVSFARRHLPFTEEYDGGRLFTRAGGRRVATPLFLVLLTIGTTDILFALDSIPEIATSTSLAVIVVVLTITTIASLLKARRDPSARAHAGTLRARARKEQAAAGG